MEPPPSNPLTLPRGSQVVAVSARSLSLRCPSPLPLHGLLSFDLLLGVRPLPVIARVVGSHPDPSGDSQLLELEFVALAQMDRDTLVDFLQAVGSGALAVRPSLDD